MTKDFMLEEPTTKHLCALEMQNFEKSLGDKLTNTPTLSSLVKIEEEQYVCGQVTAQGEMEANSLCIPSLSYHYQ